MKKRKWKPYIPEIIVFGILGALTISTVWLILSAMFVRDEVDQINSVLNGIVAVEEDGENSGNEPETGDLSEVYISSEDLDLVQRIVAAEARGESLEGQMAVVQTIRDRSVLWNLSVREVVTAKGQYAAPYAGTVSDTTKDAVWRVLIMGESVFDSPATHFHSGPDPYWAKGKKMLGTVGGHKFYY